MRYLTIKKRKLDSGPYAVPLIVHKTKKFGKVISEQALGRTAPVFLCGGPDSGKSKYLKRLHQESAGIWGRKYDSPPLWLSASQPLTAWYDQPAVRDWYEAKHGEKWSKVPTHRRPELLADYVEHAKALVFVDDADRLSRRKLEIARQCIMAAPLFAITAQRQNALSPSLFPVVMRRQPQVVQLSQSEAAADATNVMVLCLLVFLVLAGAHQLAMVVGGLRLLSYGQGAARRA